jgi:hypothetical protein
MKRDMERHDENPTERERATKREREADRQTKTKAEERGERR